jgi:SAM-dependent methyltransferase
MNTDEYLKLAEVEDQMWYFRSLHAHVQRELGAVFGAANGTSTRSSSTIPNPAGAPRPHVLDAGCGTGGLILRLRASQPEWKYAGIDFMPIACELARERCGSDVDIRVASITELPFPDQSFDAVVSAQLLNCRSPIKASMPSCRPTSSVRSTIRSRQHPNFSGCFVPAAWWC